MGVFLMTEENWPESKCKFGIFLLASYFDSEVVDS